MVRDAVTTQHVDVAEVADVLSPYAHHYGAPLGQGAALLQRMLEQAGVPESTRAAGRLVEPYLASEPVRQALDRAAAAGMEPARLALDKVVAASMEPVREALARVVAISMEPVEQALMRASGVGTARVQQIAATARQPAPPDHTPPGAGADVEG